MGTASLRSEFDTTPRPRVQTPTAAVLLSLVMSVTGCGGCGDSAPAGRDVGTRPRTITAKSGGTTILPSRTGTRTTAPSRTCVAAKSYGAQGAESVLLPPSPGLTARLGSDAVLVSYRLPEVDPRCRPRIIQFTLASESGGDPSLTRSYPVRRRRAQQAVGVPGFYADDPDVVRASTVTSDGRRSPVVSVLVR